MVIAEIFTIAPNLKIPKYPSVIRKENVTHTHWSIIHPCEEGHPAVCNNMDET